MKIKLKVTLEELEKIIDALDYTEAWLECSELFFRLAEMHDKKDK